MKNCQRLPLASLRSLSRLTLLGAWLAACLLAWSIVDGAPIELVASRLSHADGSSGTLVEVETPWGTGVVVSFELAEGGWVNLGTAPTSASEAKLPVTFLFLVDQPLTLELKFIYAGGATFGQRVDFATGSLEWRRLTIDPAEAEFWWGDNRRRELPLEFALAFSGTSGPVKVTIAKLERGPRGRPSSFAPPSNESTSVDVKQQPPLFRAPYVGPLLDPSRNMPGIGVAQRRAAALTPEDPRVLEWLQHAQDTGSDHRQLVPSTLGGNEGHTFNNALVAMAFVRHGERERAERILDFYHEAAANRDNEDPTLQSFYLRGEARGFYQRVLLREENGIAPYHAPPETDRWMGDMAWLALALCDYERTFLSDRYSATKQAIQDLLKSWYIVSASGHGGYVQHGWRLGDRQLHENYGHHEGNIDCYALFTLVGERTLARNIRDWLEPQLAGRKDLPLDLYAWRVLAYRGNRAELLDVPDFDLRYRKSVKFAGRSIVGPYSGPITAVDNVWVDGLGHLACAYRAAGNVERANFYANQMDAVILEEQHGGRIVHGLPYAANNTGDYGWVDVKKGAASAAAWYVLAKNGFNPLLIEPTESRQPTGIPIP